MDLKLPKLPNYMEGLLFLGALILMGAHAVNIFAGDEKDIKTLLTLALTMLTGIGVMVFAIGWHVMSHRDD